jgi:hypothetical protein
MERTQNIPNPYDIVDYHKIVQDFGESHVLSYSTLLEDIAPMLVNYNVSHAEDFQVLQEASEDCLKAIVYDYNIKYIDKTNHTMVADYFLDQYIGGRDTPSIVKDYDENIRIILATFMHLKAISDSTVAFGEPYIRDFLERKGLPQILADKYLDFLLKAIESRISQKRSHY